MKLGSRFKRLSANMLDSLALKGVGVVLIFLLTSLNLGLSTEFLDEYIYLALSLIYFTAFEQSKYQATPGKMLLKLYVADTDGKRLSPGRALTRFILAFWVPWLPVVGLIIMFYMSPVIISGADILGTEAVNDIKKFELGEHSYTLVLLQLLLIAQPVMTNCVLVLIPLLPLVWFMPILFKSRRGIYEKISKTIVLRR